ncbi:hypothetical protein [Alienimonas chondri]|uniref:Uncharacterized protein n=1 Tax=Alienimonas chondri TaxID=2681879 RepID=A0ABX1VHI3_9PLAN|nr:hypothetical protein [Alienimonas chondri]NNJ26723.1 hypothetical protein [Alienimonas chondri]
MLAPLPLGLAALLALAPPPNSPPRDEPEVRELIVSPAPLPDPALKHRLTIPDEARLPGSAVTYWYRAELVMAQDETIRVRNADGAAVRSRQGLAGDLLTEPPADLTAERIGRDVDFSDRGDGWESWQAFRDMEAAARRPPGDWGFGVEALSGRESVEFLLPEIQNVRGLARLITLRGRSRVGRGDYEGALADATVALRLSEDCGRAPFLVADLVAVAVTTITNDHLIEAIVAAPDSPNLYYALTERPDPAAGLADSWDFEFSFADRFAPWLKDAETREWPAERWRAELIALHEAIDELDGNPATDRDQAVATVDRLLTDDLPAAKAALVAAGLDPAAVDAMPPGQAIAASQARTLRRMADRQRVALALPPRQALAALTEIETAFTADGAPALLALSMWPSVRQAYAAGLRAQTDLAALWTIEALRAHAAASGAFPQALEDVVVVPVPENPGAGKAFGYRLEGETAVLEVIRDPARAPVNRIYRLTLRGDG